MTRKPESNETADRRASAERSSPLTLCGKCGAEFAGTLPEGRVWYADHALGEHGIDVVAVKAAQRKRTRSFGGGAKRG